MQQIFYLELLPICSLAVCIILCHNLCDIHVYEACVSMYYYVWQSLDPISHRLWMLGCSVADPVVGVPELDRVIVAGSGKHDAPSVHFETNCADMALSERLEGVSINSNHTFSQNGCHG